MEGAEKGWVLAVLPTTEEGTAQPLHVLWVEAVVEEEEGGAE